MVHQHHLPAQREGISRSRGVALYLASLLGAGLLALPAVAFKAAGPASLISWAALLLISVPVALTFASLGSAEPDAGGVASYAERAFGKPVGAWVGFCFVLALPFGAPATALVGSAYVAKAAGWNANGTLLIAVVLLLLAALSAVGGVQLAGTVQLVLTGVLVLVLLAAMVGAVPHAHASNLHPWMPHGLTGLASAAGVLFFSFAGWEAVAPLAQEFRNPKSDARATAFLTLTIVSALYMALALSSVLALGPGMNHDATPIQSLLALSSPQAAPWITAVLAAILTYGAMSAYISGAASMLAALARDGWMPHQLSQGHEAGGTPRRSAALIGSVALVALLILHALHVGVGQIMTIASAMFITVTLAGLLAGTRLLGTPRQKGAALTGALFVSIVLMGCGLAITYPIGVAATIALVHRRRQQRLLRTVAR